MTVGGPLAWADEIRAYLLGRPSKSAGVHAVRQARLEGAMTDAIRRWWVLEGKHYAALGGPLAPHFGRVRRLVEQLEATFNPRRRLSERPDGEVDWPMTLLRRGGGRDADYVVRGSAAGLDEAERAALAGWFAWIQSECAQHAQAFGLSFDGMDTRVGLAAPRPVERLRKWALITRRSRWPLLRGVVAESLRPYFEDEELDRIPLPSDPAKLFELLCLVRIARHFVPRPTAIRWLDVSSSSNTARFDHLTCRYQEPLERDRVLGTADYAGGLSEAVRAFGVRVPRFIDLVVDFDSPIGGFNGVIVEAKSGTQEYDATVAQLRTYRNARPRGSGERYLLWGIVRESEGPASPADAVRHVLDATPPNEDMWVFSSADDIPQVLDTILGAERVRRQAARAHAAAGL
ncbi:hypothetical protein TBR22_A06090 [Luteitalea sp. TBR-22]|uniref:hypothetical protein n=1 Tax=Luteitalea sp. TBR-22 TaxID=2802971 RepID=UPI001AFC1372|nr:hypothetical protein [Luteitalea sp. TBR-22]BCS31408.1 hypothetical protein TBR22_A06090 [Luteitalea sp. TBR-22]